VEWDGREGDLDTLEHLATKVRLFLAFVSVLLQLLSYFGSFEVDPADLPAFSLGASLFDLLCHGEKQCEEMNTARQSDSSRRYVTN
jgi:hypothetical protein